MFLKKHTQKRIPLFSPQIFISNLEKKNKLMQRGEIVRNREVFFFSLIISHKKFFRSFLIKKLRVFGVQQNLNKDLLNLGAMREGKGRHAGTTPPRSMILMSLHLRLIQIIAKEIGSGWILMSLHCSLPPDLDPL